MVMYKNSGYILVVVFFNAGLKNKGYDFEGSYFGFYVFIIVI